MQPECSDKQFVQHKDAELMSWHQRLGHPSDHYLHNAHKYVQGVPQFKHQDGVLDKCPACIRAKHLHVAVELLNCRLVCIRVIFNFQVTPIFNK